MKVRLYKGPFSGKVYDLRDAGATIITIRDFKRMSKKEIWKAQRKHWEDTYGIGTGAVFGAQWRPPLIEAQYKICTYKPAATRQHVLTYSNPSLVIADTIMMHPDGSLFYEWTGEKREFK